MSVFQIAYVTCAKSSAASRSIPAVGGRQVSGVRLSRSPFTLTVLEGEPGDLSELFGRECENDQIAYAKCVLYRPVANRMFEGFAATDIQSVRSAEVPRPIDLWAALNVEESDEVREQFQQVREAMRWFVGTFADSN